MPAVLEITYKPHLRDSEGQGLKRKAADYFGLLLDDVRVVHRLTLDGEFSQEELARIREDIFTNPVTQESSYKPLPVPFDWTVWIGFRPGVRDNPGATAVEAIEDLLGRRLARGETVYTSRRFCIRGKGLARADMEKLATELLANDIIQNWKVMGRDEWDEDTGIGVVIPKVKLDHVPVVTTVPMESDEALLAVSDQRNLALSPRDVPVIRGYFQKAEVQKARAKVGLTEPTDVELEYISQARSDHCNHNTFQGTFFYRDLETGEETTIKNLFKTYIKEPTLKIQKEKPWVVSVLWDNAGVARFDEENLYVITGETHNSPSNMEAYGGAITGIVGVYRDPMGTGLGSRLIAGTYGFCVAPRDYEGLLTPHLAPRRLLDGIIEGVRDGGNKSGIPTPFGTLTFDPGYLGKCLVYVTALGIMPASVAGKPSWEKTTSPGELCIMCGGRVGKDGIHGVTASSEVFSENTPAGHVQIGDPYTQKKMMDFLCEARDEGLIPFITDNGGGGLSSSVGESALLSGGVEVELDKVPLKYEGLDQWEIWVSESQERMTVAVKPEHYGRFMELSEKHAVESTVIGHYTDSGKLHIKYDEKTCAYVDLSLLTQDFPAWEFEAVWEPPEKRGLFEPVLTPPTREGYGRVLRDMLDLPNIASREWIQRQYDHEVQATSAVKPLVGRDRDMPGDAGVVKPVYGSDRGIAVTQTIAPRYGAIDAYHMTACVIDEALRRAVAVGGDPDEAGGVDNFCWPTIVYDPKTNPDGKLKAAQLVRSCRALTEYCGAYGIPLLSGKDSMYVDGHLPGPYGEKHKVSAKPSLQFTVTAIVPDVNLAQTMDVKMPGDLIYILGSTRNELGGSQYYDLLGYLGANVPKVEARENLALYRALHRAVLDGLPASVHAVGLGGLAVNLALCCMGGNLGLYADLAKVPRSGDAGNRALLFSESAGRFIVTVAPENRDEFEKRFVDFPMARVGMVSDTTDFAIRGLRKRTLVEDDVMEMKKIWKRRFGHLV